MTKLSWIRTRSTRPAPRRKASARLVLESLEDRCVPATFTVNSILDTAAPVAPVVTLRSAITAAEAGTGGDTITFDPALTGQTITLGGTALPTLTKGETITGLGSNSLTVNANNASRIFNVTSTTLVTITGLTLTGGNAGAGNSGGAILVTGGKLQLTDDTLTNNTVTGAAVKGGALDSTGATAQVTATNCTFSSNSINGSSASEGGAVENEVGATMTLTACRVTSNTENNSGNGAGLANDGSMTVTNSNISLNTGTGGSFFGAGVFNQGAGTLALTNCSIIANTSQGAGGGVWSSTTGLCNITNCTIVNNLSLSSSGGGGIRVVTGPLTLLNDTITNNTDASGAGTNAGGVSFSGTTWTMSNTVIALNFAAGGGPPDARGAVAGGSVNNFIGIGDATLTGITDGTGGNQIGTAGTPKNPLLGALQDNGVTPNTTPQLLTEKPLPGSPLINAGNSPAASTLTTDERGFVRIVGPAVDIGAVEFQPPGVSVAITVTIPPNPGPPTTPPTPPPLGPAAPANLAFHRVVTISVTVTNAAASPNPNNAPVTGTVTFLVNGTTILGTAPLDATGKATFTTTSAVPLPLGADSITARYNGDPNYNPGVSNAVAETVARPIPTPAVFDPATATWYVKNSFGAGPPSITAFQFGSPGDLPIMGDWTGTGTFGIGVFTPATATFRLRNTLSAGAPDFTFVFGPVGIGIPVAGDWNGTGVWGVGVYGQARGDFNLRTQLSTGLPDAGSFLFGSPGSIPVAGDWTGSGTFSVGVIDSADNTWKLKNAKATGTPDFTFQYGNFADQHVVGDWDGNGTWTPGVLQNNGSGSLNWLLRNSNSGGAPDIAPFLYGASTFLGVVGDPDFPVVPQLAADGQGPGAGAISQADLNNAVQADLARLQQAGVSPDVLARLSGVTALLAGLQPGQLGGAVLQGSQILLSPDGAGHGWFVDSTPMQDEEFSGGQALPGSAADGRYDLQTVVMHELGHIAGLPDDSSNGLMGTFLTEGARRLDALNAVFAS